MLTEGEKEKLYSYFGFLRRMRALTVGEEMEEKIRRNLKMIVVITPSCNDKNRRQILQLAEENSRVTPYEYHGDFPLQTAAGFKKLNAVGIENISLGEQIVALLKKDDETKEDVK